MKPQDNFYLQFEEPLRGCLLALKEIILSQDQSITPEWKYGMPMFYYKGKMFCYIWVHKKLHQPYIGLVEGKRLEHPDLVQEKRARMKIMLFDADKDLPINTIKSILQSAIYLYTSGEIKTKS